MNDIDYPLDQTVIDHTVDQLEETRKIKIGVLKDAYKDANGNNDIVVFKNRHVFRRLIDALESVGVCWYEIDGEIYVNRHEVEDIITH